MKKAMRRYGSPDKIVNCSGKRPGLFRKAIYQAMGKQQSGEFTPTVSTTRKSHASILTNAQSTEVCLNPCLVSQSIQLAKVALKTQYIYT